MHCCHCYVFYPPGYYIYYSAIFIEYPGARCPFGTSALQIAAMTTMDASRVMKAGIKAERLSYISHAERMAIEAGAETHGKTS